MKRWLAIVLMAAAVAAGVLVVMRPNQPPPHWSEPLRLGERELESLEVAEQAATRPSTWPTTRPGARSPRTDPLAGKMLQTLRHEKTPLKDVLADFRKQTGANVVVDWLVLQDLDVQAETPVTVELRDVSAATALRTILLSLRRQPELTWYADENVVWVTTWEKYAERFTVLCVYDVRDLMVDSARFSRVLVARGAAARRLEQTGSRAPILVENPLSEQDMAAALMSVLRDSAREYSWRDNGGMSGTMNYFGGRIFVTHTPDVQEQIEDLLIELRR